MGENRFVPRRLVFIDYDLDDEFSPYFRLRAIESQEATRIGLEIGEGIDFSAAKNRYCIGYHTRDDYHEYNQCPDLAKVENPARVQCFSCAARDVLLPCIGCDGTRCSEIKHPKSECQIQPTSVYLVLFGEYSKVGVSRSDRVLKRWIEQGADVGVEVAKFANGGLARLAEGLISSKMAIPKYARFDTKLKGLRFQIDQGSLGRLNDLSKQAFRLIREEQPSSAEGSLMAEALKEYYRFDPSIRPSGVTVNVSARGTYMGMKGPIFLYSGEGEWAMDFNNLRGREIGPSADSSQLSLSSFGL